MANSGEELGADLYALWRAGSNNLPRLADEYAGASDLLAQTSAGQAYAFQRPEFFGGGAYGPVYGPWTGLRDDLEKILGDTATNLELTGEALCLAAQEYAQTDAAAAEEFRRLRAVNGDLSTGP